MTAPTSYCTINVTLVLCVTPPPVPVIVSVNVPFVVAFDVLTVSVDEPHANEVGLNVAELPFGNPLTLKLTFAVNPPEGVIVIQRAKVPRIT